jgi:hypothetical protein
MPLLSRHVLASIWLAGDGNVFGAVYPLQRIADGTVAILVAILTAVRRGAAANKVTSAGSPP